MFNQEVKNTNKDVGDVCEVRWELRSVSGRLIKQDTYITTTVLHADDVWMSGQIDGHLSRHVNTCVGWHTVQDHRNR